MLAKQVLVEFNSSVRLVYEDFGESALSDRFDIKGYPAVFVNDKPVALPLDFGYAKDDLAKYTPWADPESQRRFADDLTAILRLTLEGKPFDDYIRQAKDVDPYPDTLPELTVTSTEGRNLDFKSLGGRPVIVDFWATWCPPCRRTLPEMELIQAKYSDRLTIVTVCLASPEDEMKQVGAELAPNLPVILGTDEVIAAFGNVINVPTLMVYDAQGHRRKIFIGAPEDLPQKLEALIEKMLK